MGSTEQLSSDDSEEIKLVFDSQVHWPLLFKACLTDFGSASRQSIPFMHSQHAWKRFLKIIFWFSTLKIAFVSTHFRRVNTFTCILGEFFVISTGCHSLGEDVQMIMIDIYVQYLPQMTLF